MSAGVSESPTCLAMVPSSPSAPQACLREGPHLALILREACAVSWYILLHHLMQGSHQHHHLGVGDGGEVSLVPEQSQSQPVARLPPPSVRHPDLDEHPANLEGVLDGCGGRGLAAEVKLGELGDMTRRGGDTWESHTREKMLRRVSDHQFWSWEEEEMR